MQRLRQSAALLFLLVFFGNGAFEHARLSMMAAEYLLAPAASHGSSEDSDPQGDGFAPLGHRERGCGCTSGRSACPPGGCGCAASRAPFSGLGVAMAPACGCRSSGSVGWALPPSFGFRFLPAAEAEVEASEAAMADIPLPDWIGAEGVLTPRPLVPPPQMA